MFATVLSVGAIAVVVAAMYVRLAPSDPARWHTPPNVYAFDHGVTPAEVITLANGAALFLDPASGAPADLLARLDAIAMATPRTTRLAGGVAAGRITWVTRSALWGFPDYTTAEAREGGLYIHARLRFGKSDLGVNVARLRDWQAKL